MNQEEALFIAIKVYYSLLIIVGLPANLLTLHILIQRCRRGGEDRCTSSLYLIALAIADSLVLITIVIVYEMIFSMVPPGEFCPYLNMLEYGAHNASIWIIVAYTIERFIGVYFPVWKFKVSNPTTAKFAICGVFLLSYLFAIPEFFTVSATTKEVLYGNITTYRCNLKEDLPVKFRLGVIWGHSVLFYMLPFILIIVLNGLIICKLRGLRRVGPQRAWTFPSASRMSNNRLRVRARSTERSESDHKVVRNHFQPTKQRGNRDGRTERTRTGNIGNSRRKSRVTTRDQQQPRFRTNSPERRALSSIIERSHSEIILTESEPRLSGEIGNQPCSSQTNRKEATLAVKIDGNPTPISSSQGQRFFTRPRTYPMENITPHGPTRFKGRPILILIIVSATIVLLWFPRFIIFLILRINDQSRFEIFSHKVASEIATMLGLLNSSINMFLYSFVDSRFRSSVFRILSCGEKSPNRTLARATQRQTNNTVGIEKD
ncbi:uncharacterized protein LOC144866209 [Branchiostoma floridae x Branchiostoma japonicum]